MSYSNKTSRLQGFHLKILMFWWFFPGYSKSKTLTLKYGESILKHISSSSLTAQSYNVLLAFISHYIVAKFSEILINLQVFNISSHIIFQGFVNVELFGDFGSFSSGVYPQKIMSCWKYDVIFLDQELSVVSKILVLVWLPVKEQKSVKNKSLTSIHSFGRRPNPKENLSR